MTICTWFNHVRTQRPISMFLFLYLLADKALIVKLKYSKVPQKYFKWLSFNYNWFLKKNRFEWPCFKKSYNIMFRHIFKKKYEFYLESPIIMILIWYYMIWLGQSPWIMAMCLVWQSVLLENGWNWSPFFVRGHTVDSVKTLK